MRLLLLFLLLAAFATVQPTTASPDDRASFETLDQPIVFVKNLGQWPEEVRFRTRIAGVDLWITDRALVYDFYRMEGPVPTDGQRAQRAPSLVERDGPEAAIRRGHVIVMRFEEAQAQRVTGQGLETSYHNYFLGNDADQWASRVPTYNEVVLEDLYEGIDLRLYTDGGLPRYDLVLAPRADLSRVQIRLEGTDGLALTPEGALRMETSLGPVEQRGLLAYQHGSDGQREVVPSAFRLGPDGTLRFAAENVDTSRGLVIDPLIWSTFLGGSNFDFGWFVTLDANRVTVAGLTMSSAFPTTPGAYDTTLNGTFRNLFVTQFTSDGSTLLYSTFFGGTGTNSRLAGLALDTEGRITIAGETSSSDLPVTVGAYDTSFSGSYDAFATRFSADGSDLLYSTYFGGAEVEFSEGMALEPDGSLTLIGHTESADLPTTPGAFDTSFNGERDIFAARLSPDGSTLLYSTFIGGTGWDHGSGVALDENGDAIITGTIFSSSEPNGFPLTPGAFDTSFNGVADAVIVRLSADWSALVFATALGGASNDYINDVAVGPDGSIIVGGLMHGAGFPTTPGAFDTSYDGGSGDAFLTSLSADGSSLLYSTYLGSTDFESATALAVGPDGSVTLTGATTSADFPTSPDAYDTSYNSVRADDVFVTRFSADGSALLYSTFFGAAKADSAYDVALDSDGSAVIIGITFSTNNFPTTPGAFDTSSNGEGDAFVARFDVGLALCPLSFNDATLAPLTVAPGGLTTVSVDVANAGPGSRVTRLDLRYARDGGPSGTLVLGSGRVGVTSSVGTSAEQTVPAGAPSGSYDIQLDLVDTGTGDICDNRTFTLTVDGAPASGPAIFTSQPVTNLFAESAAASANAAASEVTVWPNPASGQAALTFALAEAADVRLALYDVLGREVSVPQNGPLDTGTHRLALDVSGLPAGIYVWRLVAGERVEAGRFTLVR